MSVEEKHWYGLNVTYARERKAKIWFDAQGIECFLPMRYVERSYMGRTRRMLVPAFHNLIFIHADNETLHEVVRQTDLPVRCIMDRTTRRPMIVSDREMSDFMAAAESGIHDAEYLPAGDANYRSGERVRVTQGPLEGIEGIYLRSGNGGRIAVQIAGMTALTVALPAHFVEKTESNQPQPTTR